MMMNNTLDIIKNRILNGGTIEKAEALELAENADTDELCDVADELRKHFCGNVIDTCSIVNARSGHCSEDCKWCAQSRFHHTGIEEYEIVPVGDAMAHAEANDRAGVMRFSMVTSGRRVAHREMEKFCEMYRQMGKQYHIELCASMGLIDKDGLKMLLDAGVKRYHCNMETSEEFFATLCTTHTAEDKRKTIRMAQELGMEVCSGGIIGMGETMKQRVDFAYELSTLGVVSVPINILNPIAGTALENTPLITEDEVIRTVALFRLIMPKITLRFAGGRARLSHKCMARIMRGGMNGALVGDMLTTIGNKMSDDDLLFEETGFVSSRTKK